MSNALRYDALLVRDLAAELNAALAGARLEGAFLERDALRVTLQTRASRRADAVPPSLTWELHPDSGRIVVAAANDPDSGRVQLRAPSIITSITTPPDERLIIIELATADAHAGAARRIIIELMTNQWNAIAVGGEDRITAVLRERSSKERQLRAGVPYRPPTPSSRAGAAAPIGLDAWREIMGAAPPGERLRAVLRIAYASPLNAAHIVGDADVDSDDAALERAWQRYLALVWTAPRSPVLLADGQPYSMMLEGATSQPTLLEAFSASAGTAPARAGTDAEETLSLIASRIDAIERRVARLGAEQAGAMEEAQLLRHRADVLMTQLHAVPRGAGSVRLHDFDGTALEVELDPKLNAAQNAARLYDSARRRDRAGARIPRLVEEAHDERRRLEMLAGRVRDGAATSEELAGLRSAERTRADREGRVLPYREYRTRGGTEVRVGRGSKANDELTFRHSAPTDIWLHARDVAGAHVILRWPHTESNPSAADINDAAVLAALYSRARTSGVVAVDWTRRKHVRKPRKSAPGAVIPERVKTVFVEPDPALEQMLRQG